MIHRTSGERRSVVEWEGFEPSSFRIQTGRSTAELLPQTQGHKHPAPSECALGRIATDIGLVELTGFEPATGGL